MGSRHFMLGMLLTVVTALPLSAGIVGTISLDGNGTDVITSMVRKPDGSLIVAGYTTSTQFDGLPDGVVLPDTGTGKNAFVAIVSADLSTITKAAFIAGKGDDIVNDIAILTDYRVCLVGTTNSDDFPVMGSAVGQQRGGGTDGFVAIFSADLSKQTLGVLIAGNKDDVANGVAIVNTGAIVVVGSTASDQGIRGQKNYDDTLAGSRDAYIWMLHSSLSYVDFFTYVGGLETDSFSKVVLDKNSDIVAVGTSTSQDCFTYPRKILVPDGEDPETGEPIYKEVGKNPYGAQPFGGASDVIVTKFNLSGDPVFSTYMGGKGADEGVDLFINSDNDVVIVGNTTSSDLVISATSGEYGGLYDCFVAMISKDGLRLGGTSYLGGSRNDFVTAVVQWSNGQGMLVGRTESNDFPTMGAGATSAQGNAPSGFIAIADAYSNTFSSVLAMSGDEMPSAVVVDVNQDAYIAGSNIMPSMPVAEPNISGFVSKWAFGAITYQSPTPQESLCGGQTVKVRWTVLGFNSPAKMFVDFSTDNGKTWTQVGSNITTNTFDLAIPANIPADAQCLIQVRSDRGHHVQTASPLAVGITPTFQTQPPASVAACPSDRVVLTVEVIPPTASIQWRFNGTPIPNATTATLTLDNATAAMSGTYDVLLTNSCGSVTSNASVVLVSNAPQIDKQPDNQTVREGESVTLSVEARGSNLTYKWFLDGGLVRGANPTTATLTLDNVTKADQGTYTCEVGSACGSVTTSGASVTVEVASSVDENTSALLRLWPQPANDVLMVEFAQGATVQDIIVRTLQGSEVIRFAATPNQQASTTLNLGMVPQGLYVLEIQERDRTSTVPFVVVR
ncbi:MAG: immunoglobulin domain-containing protein [Bradyrhizobiaceae bacterium]|nr:immunoglobulin domain-containing protein [Bradyrhizobiaceae bacterium]